MTLRYEDGKPVAATAIVVSTQHGKGYDEGDKEAELHAYVKQVVADVIPAELLVRRDRLSHQPDRQLRDRRPRRRRRPDRPQDHRRHLRRRGPARRRRVLGKDPTKVDRSAAYVTRYLAKNIVAAGLAKRCTIQLAYAIGVAEPLSLYVDTHGTGTVGDDKIEAAIGEHRQARRPDPARHPHASRPQQADLRSRPPPTAISAASPKATSSRGRRPTWSTT